MIRVLIVDDHLIIRRGLVQILNECGVAFDVCEAGDGVQAMQQLRASAFDAVLLDVALGDRDGFDVLKSIRGEFPKLGVVMLSVYPEAQFAVRAIRSGANAYLNKGCSADELTQALVQAARGEVYVTSSTASLMVHDLRKPVDDQPLHSCLSNRELQVLRLMAKGQSVQQIANALCLSGNTVSTYRARVFDKLDFRNLVDLVNYASKHGL